MPPSGQLYLYEEILLLALNNEKGISATGNLEYALAAAILAELSLENRISIDASGKHLVSVDSADPLGEPVIDECLEKISAATRPDSLQTLIPRLAGIPELRHKIARQLCTRGILRADEENILLIFTRKIYPEVNPVPEKEVIERLRMAIFTDQPVLDPRTVVLISLANSTDLLNRTFGVNEVRQCKQRIEQIIKGELLGDATKAIAQAVDMAVMVSVMMPLMMLPTQH